MGLIMVPSAVLATDTFHFQNHFPWSESVTEAGHGFPPPLSPLLLSLLVLFIYFDPLLNLGFIFLWFPTSALCSSIVYMILG